jgi:hypothetical protein
MRIPDSMWGVVAEYLEDADAFSLSHTGSAQHAAVAHRRERLVVARREANRVAMLKNFQWLPFVSLAATWLTLLPHHPMGILLCSPHALEVLRTVVVVLRLIVIVVLPSISQRGSSWVLYQQSVLLAAAWSMTPVPKATVCLGIVLLLNTAALWVELQPDSPLKRTAFHVRVMYRYASLWNALITTFLLVCGQYFRDSMTQHALVVISRVMFATWVSQFTFELQESTGVITMSLYNDWWT